MAPNQIAIDPASLIAAGFNETTYAGQSGTFYRRDTKVATMPYLSKQVDGEFIFSDSIASTEVRPDGMVHLHIADTDYLEGPIDGASEEGQGLLADSIAGVAETALVAHRA